MHRKLLVCGVVMVGSVSVFACEPRETDRPPVVASSQPIAPTSSPPSTATTTAPPATTTAPTATGTTAPPFTLPGVNIAGLPASPRAALVGRWNVMAIDGKPVASSPGMATNPLDPATYVAGAIVTFTADQVTLSRQGATLMNKPYKVVSEMPPLKVTIDAGYGPSDATFNLDGSVFWTLPSQPTHVLTLQRAT